MRRWEKPVEEMSDADLLMLYSEWSEETYAAGFITPSPYHVERFIEWLTSPLTEWEQEEIAGPKRDYEFEFLEEFRRQWAARAVEGSE